ncbi:hypothetical protein GCM10023088_68570 [Actinomadura verrucosospora]|uniref:hypothetical protein n=1 Tax=Actinomadura TaxID=1988 RepID=UPI0031EC9104
MRPLRLTKTTWKVVAEWAGSQTPEKQRLAAKFLRALLDGSWVAEFDNTPTSPEVVTVLLDSPRVPAYMTIFEADGVEFGEVFAIEDDPQAGEYFDTGERLGVDPEPEAGLDGDGRRPPPDPPELYPEPGEGPEEFAQRVQEFRRSS